MNKYENIPSLRKCVCIKENKNKKINCKKIHSIKF